MPSRENFSRLHLQLRTRASRRASTGHDPGGAIFVGSFLWQTKKKTLTKVREGDRFAPCTHLFNETLAPEVKDAYG